MRVRAWQIWNALDLPRVNFVNWLVQLFIDWRLGGAGNPPTIVHRRATSASGEQQTGSFRP